MFNILIISGFFSGETDFGKTFLKAAAQNREDFVFAHTNDAELSAEAGHTEYVCSGILCYY